MFLQHNLQCQNKETTLNDLSIDNISKNVIRLFISPEATKLPIMSLQYLIKPPLTWNTVAWVSGNESNWWNRLKAQFLLDFTSLTWL